MLSLVVAQIGAIMVAHSTGSCPAQLDNNTNYFGSDIPPKPADHPGHPTKDLAGCCALCNSPAFSSCYFFTFVPDQVCRESPKGTPPGCCHPKTSRAGAKLQQGYVSGASSTHVPPAPGVPTPAPPTPAPKPAPAGAKNVLMLVADDLRPNLNASYSQLLMNTPQLDRFASESLVFTRFYVQQTVCSPSRNSFMSGRTPDATRVYNFIDDFRSGGHKDSAEAVAPGANWSTLPGYFKNHGYQVFGCGKVGSLLYDNQHPTDPYTSTRAHCPKD
jgi:hypothetical protein